MYKCYVIGISDSRSHWFAPVVSDVIRRGKVFSGGRRHHDAVRDMLPDGYTWIEITTPLSNVFEKYKRYDEVVVFASGDPLFYGFASTVRRELPDCEMIVYSSFNSLQLLAHRMLLPYQDMRVVSLTGRPWDRFDEALIAGEKLIGVLTDRTKTPDVICRRMMDYGYDNYSVTIGECLGNETEERVSEYVEGANVTYKFPNCLILKKERDRERTFGIPESRFALLNGRVNMITKSQIRLAAISAMDLGNARVFWDVGFCTGSVSIEAKRLFPALRVESFEIRSECEDIIYENMRRFGTPGINVHIGDFLTTDLTGMPVPDAVFIGGHGGCLSDIVEKIIKYVTDLSNGRGVHVTINSVTEKSRKEMYETAERLKLSLLSDNKVMIDEHNPINIITFVS